MAQLKSNHWEATKFFKGPKLQQVWKVVLSASLWTLWLGRNEMVFQKKLLCTSMLKFLVKIRSFKSILAYGGLKEELEFLWRVNPVRALLLNRKSADLESPL